MDEYTPELDKKCKNGMYKNKKTGKCVKKTIRKKNTLSLDPDSIPNPLGNLPSVTEDNLETYKASKKEKCKKGTRKNKKTGLCEPVKEKINIEMKTIENLTHETSVSTNISSSSLPFVEKKDDEKEKDDDTTSTKIPEKDIVGEIIIEKTIYQDGENDTTKDSSPSQTRTEDVIDLFAKETNKNENVLSMNENIQQPQQIDGNNLPIQNAENILYPDLEDIDFSLKIAQHKEFAETMYDGTITDVQKQADFLSKAKYELMPHQLFVKNFLSIQTPYNSLLLYHMLGTGKTCSAIGIAEEMRSYIQQMGIKKKIIFVASPNVQNNFKKELFDERNLKEVNGLWILDRTCIGNALLKEINPMNLKGLTREHIVQQIQFLISQHYSFMGYIEFANYIANIMNSGETREKKIQNIRNAFNDQLVIIDEVHNIGMADNNSNKRTGMLLYEVAQYSESMRLLLLSATPMYNSPYEIIWLTNLLNANDKRETIAIHEVFDNEGKFLTKRGKKKGKHDDYGRELLRRKLIGYVSFVRGENPYLFPFRVYPELFAKEENKLKSYPKKQMNGREIKEFLKHVPVYMTKIGSYQNKGYQYIIQNMIQKAYNIKQGTYDEKKMPSFENMESFGYTMLYAPMEALNIVYPTEELDEVELCENAQNEKCDFTNSAKIISGFIGKKGLKSVMNYIEDEKIPLRYDFDYSKSILKKYGRIFSPELLHKYSAKISHICDQIKQSKGIVLVYSQYIDGGLVPMALALEEMGFARYGPKNLLKNAKAPAIDALTMKTRKEMGNNVGNFQQAKYVMITGDKHFSANNDSDIKYVSSVENKYGRNVKVILISKAASEGVDFKNIRQLHILESWYNMNRIEQIIGRAVRNKSHVDLPFKERNVQIFLHATKLEDQEREAADLYVYRVAERKSKLIGQVTRLLKQNAVDCVLNISQTNFTEKKINEIIANQNITLELSNGEIIEKFPVGDKPYSDLCDYMDNCAFQCEVSNPNEEHALGTNANTYTEDFIQHSSMAIMHRIRDIYRENFAYKSDEIIREINILKRYPIDHIYYTLGKMIGNKTEELVDKYGRIGYLINRGNYYAFQPMEISDEHAQMLERIAPVEYKHSSIKLELPKGFNERMHVPLLTSAPLSENDSVVVENKQQLESQMPMINEMIPAKPNTFESLLQSLNDVIEMIHKPNLVVAANDKNWYKHTNKYMRILIDMHDLKMEDVNKYSIYHFLDSLELKDKMLLVEEFYKNNKKLVNKIEVYILNYFNQRMVEKDGKRAVVLGGKTKNEIYIQDEKDKSKWKLAEYSEVERFKAQFMKFVVDKKRIFTDIGFMHPFKGREIVFKIKNTQQKRNNMGAKCEDASKTDIANKLKSVMGTNIYDDSKIDKYGLGVILEFVMRFKTEENEKTTNGPLYFFDLEKTLLNNIPDYKSISI